MPVTVHAPIRIRIDADALANPAAGLAALEDALDAALPRALANARQVVLDARGGYVTPELHAPTFTWLGSGLGHLAADDRAGIEAAIAAGITRSIKATALDRYRDAHFEAAAPLAATDVYENLDDLRADGLLGLYAIPSYDKGRAIAAPLTTKRKTPPRAAPTSYRWMSQKRANPARPLQLPAERELLLAMVRSALRQHAFRPTGINGVLWRQNDPDHPWGIYFDIGRPQWWSYILQPILHYTARPHAKPGESAWTQRTVELPPTPATLRVVATATDAPQLLEQLFKFRHARMRAGIEAANPWQEKQITRAKYDEVIEKAIVSGLKHEVEQVPSYPVFVAEYTAAALREYFTLSTGGAPAWPGEAFLLPVVEAVTPPAHGPSDKGGAGRKGAPAAGKPGGEAKGGVKGGSGEGDAEPGTVKLHYPRYNPDLNGEQCASLSGEPPYANVKGAAELLGGMIEDIARRLDIPACAYAARFCSLAADAIRVRARDVGEMAARKPTVGTLRNVAEKAGNFGTVDFTPTASTPILFLQRLAGVVPRLSRLIQAVNAIYKEHFDEFGDDRPHSFTSWFNQFNAAINVQLENAAGEIFIAGCRSVMVDLLATSAQQIQQRIKMFDAYAPLFTKLILTQIAPIEDLQKLERRLREKIHPAGAGARTAEVVMATWHLSIDRLREIATRSDEATAMTEGEIVATGGSYSIADRYGHLWTLAELENAIAIRGNTASAIDPMVKQITDRPALLAEFKENPSAIREHLQSLLNTMKEENKRILGEAKADPLYAFQQGGFVEKGYGVSISGLSFELTGVHSNVHNLIVDFYENDPFYAMGLQSVFKTQKAKKLFWQVGDYTLNAAIIVLSIAVPPLGIAAGVLMAAHGMDKAREREGFYRSMIDPEEFITWADVEAELFAAELGLALSFIPVAGKVLGTGAKAAQAGTRSAVKAAVTPVAAEGAIAAARALKNRFSAYVAQALKESLLLMLADELLKNELQDLLMEKLIFTPMQEAILREYSVDIRKAADKAQGQP